MCMRVWGVCVCGVCARVRPISRVFSLFTDSINCKELTTESAYVDTEQLHVAPKSSPGTQPELDWCVLVCVDISLIDNWASVRVFPSSYPIISFKIKLYLSVHGSPVDAWGSPTCGLY